MLKKWVFSRQRNVMELTVRSDSGREFQTKGPETQNALSPSLERVLGVGYKYDSTLIRRSFDAPSTAYQRSLRSQWRHPIAAVTLTYSFIYAATQQPAHRDRRTDVMWVVERTSRGRIAVESKSNYSCNQWRIRGRRRGRPSPCSSM